LEAAAPQGSSPERSSAVEPPVSVPALILQPKAVAPAGAVHNPHEPQAQWAAKGVGRHKKEGVGYKVQVGESLDDTPLAPGEPTRQFITAMVTQPAIGSDEAGLELVGAEKLAMGQELPLAQYVDAAYVSAEKLAQAAQDGRPLIGPAQPAPRVGERFNTQDFQVSIAQRQAVCPAGQTSSQCSRLQVQATGKVNFRFEWSYHCADCPLRGQCCGVEQKHRTLLVGQYHDFLQGRRQEQQTEAFRLECRKRNALEGTQSELVRAHDLRHARYRGLAKVRMQNYMIGAACNAKRWIRRLQWNRQQERCVQKSQTVA
jgi:transposase